MSSRTPATTAAAKVVATPSPPPPTAPAVSPEVINRPKPVKPPPLSRTAFLQQQSGARPGGPDNNGPLLLSRRQTHFSYMLAWKNGLQLPDSFETQLSRFVNGQGYFLVIECMHLSRYLIQFSLPVGRFHLFGLSCLAVLDCPAFVSKETMNTTSTMQLLSIKEYLQLARATAIDDHD
jgi:hypothetical protein